MQHLTDHNGAIEPLFPTLRITSLIARLKGFVGVLPPDFRIAGLETVLEIKEGCLRSSERRGRIENFRGGIVVGEL